MEQKRPLPPRVVVCGSTNTDLVLACPRLPKPGETLLGGKFRESPGGKGANQAVAAARAGAHVTFIGAMGDDHRGLRQRAGLSKEGIELRYFRTLPGTDTGVALVILGGTDRQNLIGVAHSANDRVSATQVRAAGPAIKRAGCVLAQLEIPLSAVSAAAGIARRNHVPFVLNPAPARLLPDALLPLVDYLVPNESEAELLSGKSHPESAAKELIKRGCKRVLLTLGAQGALFATPDKLLRVRAPKVRAVDTVGAGDCLCGWLATGIAGGMDLCENIRLAVRAAAYSVTLRGAQEAMPRKGFRGPGITS